MKERKEIREGRRKGRGEEPRGKEPEVWVY